MYHISVLTVIASLVAGVAALSRTHIVYSVRIVKSSSAHMLATLMCIVHKEPQTFLVFARQDST